MNTFALHFIWYTKIKKFFVIQSSYCINYTTSHVHRISLPVSFFGFLSRFILPIEIYQNQTKQKVDSVYNQSLTVIRNREASFNFKCNIQK